MKDGVEQALDHLLQCTHPSDHILTSVNNIDKMKQDIKARLRKDKFKYDF
jgi:hypothetical protein